MSRLHGRTNAALDNPVDSAMTVIKTLAHDEPISIRLQNDFLFLGQRHLKVPRRQMPVFSTVIDTFNRGTSAGFLSSNETDIPGYSRICLPACKLRSRQPVQQLTCEPRLNRSVKGIDLEERRDSPRQSDGQDTIRKCRNRSRQARPRLPRKRHDRVQASQAGDPKHRGPHDERRGIVAWADHIALP